MTSDYAGFTDVEVINPLELKCPQEIDDQSVNAPTCTGELLLTLNTDTSFIPSFP